MGTILADITLSMATSCHVNALTACKRTDNRS